MENINNIKDAAVAFWRLQKWVSSVDVERKIAAESSLRTLSGFLKENRVDVIDLTGQYYDPGLSVEVLFFEDESSESDNTPVIIEMMKPIVIQDGSVVEFGQVVIAKNPNTNKQLGTLDNKIIDKEECDDDKNISVQIVKSNKIMRDLILNKVLRYSFIVIISAAIIVGFIYIGYQMHRIDKSLISVLEKQSEMTKLQNIDESFADMNRNIDIIGGKVDDLLELPNPNTNQSEPIIDNRLDYVSWAIYTIKKGDTLYSVCSKKGINYYSWHKIILRMNGIDDANTIYVDQVILLPVVVK